MSCDDIVLADAGHAWGFRDVKGWVGQDTKACDRRDTGQIMGWIALSFIGRKAGKKVSWFREIYTDGLCCPSQRVHSCNCQRQSQAGINALIVHLPVNPSDAHKRAGKNAEGSSQSAHVFQKAIFATLIVEHRALPSPSCLFRHCLAVRYTVHHASLA